MADIHGRHTFASQLSSEHPPFNLCTQVGKDCCPLKFTKGVSHSDAHFILFELVRMLWVFEHIGWAFGLVQARKISLVMLSSAMVRIV